MTPNTPAEREAIASNVREAITSVVASHAGVRPCVTVTQAVAAATDAILAIRTSELPAQGEALKTWRKVQQAHRVGDPHGFAQHSAALTAALQPVAERRSEPQGEAEEERRADIKRSIQRQLGTDPHADRIILQPTDWDIVLAALAAPTQSGVDMVLVPREPTEAMIHASQAVDIEVLPTNISAMLTGTSAKEARAIWSAMLAAAPEGGERK